MNLSRSLIAVAASAALALGAAAPAFADVEVQTVTLPDGSTIATVFANKDQLWGASQAGMVIMHCNPDCDPTEATSASATGGIASSLVPALGNIGAAAVFGHNLPENVGDNNTTTVTQEGGGASATTGDATAVQGQIQGQLAQGGDATNINAPITANTNLVTPITTNVNTNVPIALGGDGGGVVNNNGNGNCTTGLGVGGCTGN